MNETKDRLKNFFSQFKESDYPDTVDFHIHSNASDGKLSSNEIIEQAREKGLKYFSICDHNTLNGYKTINPDDYPELITGIEFDCWYRGIFLHLLGYGIDVNSEYLKPFLANKKEETSADIVRIFSTRNLEKLIEAIHNSGGIAILAHPACCWTICPKHFSKILKDIGLDGMEVYYTYQRHRSIIKFHKTKTIEKIAEELDLIKTGGSDTHGEIIKNKA